MRYRYTFRELFPAFVPYYPQSPDSVLRNRDYITVKIADFNLLDVFTLLNLEKGEYRLTVVILGLSLNFKWDLEMDGD